jgi:hypothetical protein
VASSSLQAWSSDLSQSLSSLVESLLQYLPAEFHDTLNTTFTDLSTTPYATVAAVLLPLIFLLYRYLMSSYGSYSTYGGGRNGGSPYTSHIVEPSARNLSGHFEYIDADHDMLHDPHRASTARLPNDVEDPDAPDIVHARYMASMIPVKFPAYAISEEKALVGQLREAVARYLQTDPRRVRLVYKKRDLKHDSWPLRRYNMKQNSECAAIVTESLLDYNDKDSHSSSGEDSGTAASQNPRRRPRAASSVRHRSDEQIPQQSTPTSSSFLHPNGHVPSSTASERQSRGSERQSSPGLRPEADARAYRREPSRNRGGSPHPAPAPSIPPADPNTPLGKLQTLSDVFHERWLPLCRQFISNPPSDPQARNKEYRKLSESLMTHIFLKADAIEVNSPETRSFRKSLINEANETVRRLDALGQA